MSSFLGRGEQQRRNDQRGPDSRAPQCLSRCYELSYLFVLTAHPLSRSGLSIFLPAQSRKKSNSTRAVEPSIPICVWPLSLPLKIGSSTLSESAGPTLRVRLAFIAATAASCPFRVASGR